MRTLQRLASSMHDIGSALVRRGTAMGPLLPSLMAVPILLLFSWLFLETAVLMGFPIISVVLIIASLWILYDYHRHYGKFAKNDPDRLQSEEYRFGMTRVQMVAAKSLPQPMPEEILPLDEPTRNLTGANEQEEADESNASATKVQETEP